MANWLERARREIRETPGHPAAKTDETGVSAATAAPQPGESGISGGGFGSFGSTPAAGFREIEGANQGEVPVDLSGVSPEFAARLSPEDLADIEAGDIPLGTVQAFEAAAVGREAEDLKEFFEERAGILEYDAGLPRPEAELEAGRLTATLGRNRGYLWASLRAALAGYPDLLALVPDTPGPVDGLPLGIPSLAVLPGRRVLRQGEFTGGHEVTP